MSAPAYRPLDVLATLEALGVSKTLRDAFYEAAEDYPIMNIKQMNDAMRSAGLGVDDRVAVKKRMEGGPPPPTPPASAPASVHQEARPPHPLAPWCDCGRFEAECRCVRTMCPVCHVLCSNCIVLVVYTCENGSDGVMCSCSCARSFG